MRYSDDPITNMKIEIFIEGMLVLFFVVSPVVMVLFTSRHFSTFNLVVCAILAVRSAIIQITGRIHVIQNSDLYIMLDSEESITEEEEDEEETK